MQSETLEANNEEELALWSRAVGQDEAARGELAERLEAYARPWLAFRVPSHEVENLMQEAQLSLLKLMNRGVEVRRLYGFFHARCLAVFTDWIRARRRGEVLVGDVPLDPVDESFRPADTALYAELEVALAVCRQALKSELQSVWRLRYEFDAATKEIASKLELPYGTVLSRLFDARKAIWLCLERKQVLESN